MIQEIHRLQGIPGTPLAQVVQVCQHRQVVQLLLEHQLDQVLPELLLKCNTISIS